MRELLVLSLAYMSARSGPREQATKLHVNDYVAPVLGMTRDDCPFNEV